MKNRKIYLTAMLFVVALAITPIIQAAPHPDGGPVYLKANITPRPDGGLGSASDPRFQHDQTPVLSIHSTGDVTRGKTGAFVLDMKPRLLFGQMFVTFTVSGTAVPGVDYVPVTSPAYIGQSGYGTILIQTLPDPRGSLYRGSYSVVVTLDDGLGYAVAEPNSATIWIKPSLERQ